MAGIGLDELIGLETAVWQALVDGDAAADTDLLAEGFLGVYPDGFAGRGDHAGQLAGGPTVASYEIVDARSLEVSPSAAMLSYLATYRRPGSPPDAEPEAMYVSSLWCLRGGRWINVFSQDTPVGPPGP